MTIFATGDPRQNRLLAVLPGEVYARLAPDLEQVEMPLGAVLHEADAQLTHLYFPTTSVVAVVQAMANGVHAGIATIGAEGLVGLALFIGGDTTPNRALVQSPGEGFRMRAQLLRVEFDRAGALLDLLLRYSRTLIAQMVLTTACNRRHSVEQQFCRWLLSSLDRQASSAMMMTHPMAADMLGIGPDAVETLARRLQSDGLIRYGADRIELSDRAAMEARACECYAAVRKEAIRPLFEATPDLG